MRWLLVLLLACSSSKKPKDEPTPASGASDPWTMQRRLDIKADKRIELLSIVMRLAGAPEYQRASSRYADEVDLRFKLFANDPAVQITAELRGTNGIAYDAPLVLAVHLDEGYRPDNIDEVPKLEPRWKGVDLVRYADALRAFAKESDFDAFFTAQYRTYEAATAKLRALDNPIPFFDKLFGAQGKHVAVPGLLLGNNNVGVRNGDTYYQVLSDPTLALLVHEMAHSYINPMFAKRAAELERAGNVLYPLFADAMRAQHYTDWKIMLNEAAVRALTVYYMRTVKGDREGAVQARTEMRAGFPYINELAEVFRKYERDGAPKFEQNGVPELVAFFDALATLYAASPPKFGFIGPFDAVLRDDYVLSLPEKGALHDYAKGLPFFANKEIVTGMVDGKAIVAYGTPASNPAVAQAIGWGLWKIEKDGIELGAKKFPGEHLVLIACWFRRDDPLHGIAVYAAADEADLVGINHKLKHGPNDWLVAKRNADGSYAVVEAGDWRVENNAWVPF